jgi:AhpD family alkylhydroperoxidase
VGDKGSGMKQGFDKRIFTAGTLITDIGFLSYKLPEMVGLLRDKKISKALIEKIMTVVSAVNGCTYCTWFHAKQAISSGISEEEVKNMLNLQFHADASDFELLALLYAQHYAETNRNPDNEMTAKLFEYYGITTAKHITLIIRMIFFGNLLGNTFDAFLSRLRGNKAQNSNGAFEAIFFIFTAPFMLPATLLSRKYRQNEAGINYDRSQMAKHA